MEYIKSLPINDTPEIFGLHENANITFAQNETFAALGSLVKLQPKTASGGGKSREEVSPKINSCPLGMFCKRKQGVLQVSAIDRQIFFSVCTLILI